MRFFGVGRPQTEFSKNQNSVACDVGRLNQGMLIKHSPKIGFAIDCKTRINK